MSEKRRISVSIICLLSIACLFGNMAYAAENKLVVHADQGEHEISRFIYGHFAEHLGRCIYEGIWVGEDSPIPNTRGIRNDVVKALKRIKVPVVRWPGGCFAEEYHWMDGIGPREERPSMINTNWGGVTENNHFGTHEFLDFCEQVGAEPYICGNIGSGTVEEFSNWVEYITFDGSSPMADLRRKNGRDKPWKVKYWAVGNENDGCGGQMLPEYYAHLYRRFQTYLREYPGNELYKVATGSDPSFMEQVVKMSGEYINGIAYHYYCYPGPSRSATEFEEEDWFLLLQKAFLIDKNIQNYIAIMDKYDREKSIDLVIDEWGTWFDVEPGTNPGFLYQQNTLRDAILTGIHFNIFHRYKRVHMTNIAQTVNVLQAMILTKNEKMVLTPTYHVFDMYKVHQDATYLPLELECGDYKYDGKGIPAVTATASRDDTGRIHISICNVDPNKGATVRCEIRGANFKKVSGSILTAPKINTHNTFDNPDAIKPAEFSNVKIKGDQLVIKMPSKSIVALELD
jgi:alpha-N-arabinofuranosidase